MRCVVSIGFASVAIWIGLLSDIGVRLWFAFWEARLVLLEALFDVLGWRLGRHWFEIWVRIFGGIVRVRGWHFHCLQEICFVSLK